MVVCVKTAIFILESHFLSKMPCALKFLLQKRFCWIGSSFDLYLLTCGGDMLKKLFSIFMFTAVVLSAHNANAENGAQKLSEEEVAMNEVSQVQQEKKDDEIVANALFNQVWDEFATQFGESNIILPSQVVFLNGAPGAGKGTNTLTVMRILEIPTKPIEVSSLLNSPECEELKAQGKLIADDIVVRQVMNELLRAENARGVIIDGFPRSPIQAYFLKCLIAKLDEQNNDATTVFRMINFSVTKQTSIDRQLARGEAAKKQNELAIQNGQPVVSVRETDMSEEAAENRYNTYAASAYRCVAILENVLDVYDISAEGTMDEVRSRIYDILPSQSSQEK